VGIAPFLFLIGSRAYAVDRRDYGGHPKKAGGAGGSGQKDTNGHPEKEENDRRL
jgi:hypothetical protein